MDVLLLNVQALSVDKIHLLESEYLHDDSINLICLTEVWYGNKYLPTFTGFKKVTEFNRKQSRGGGLGIWARQHLFTTSINVLDYSIDMYFEVCAMKWYYNGRTTVVVLCYRSQAHLNIFPLCNGLYNILNKFFSPHVDFLILGDFNADPIRDAKDFQQLSDIMSMYGLSNIVTKPTRGKYILDHVFMRRGSSLVMDNIVSDHRTILCSSGIHHLPDRAIFHFVRKFGHRETLSFFESLDGEQWDGVFHAPCVDRAWEAFSLTLSHHYNNSFPLTKSTFRNSNNKEWITNEIRASSANLRDLYHTQKKFNQLRTLYQEARRHHLRLIQDSKKRFYQQLIFSSNNIIKSSWRVINKLSGKKSTSNDVIAIKDQHGALITDTQVIANNFNTYFREAPALVLSQIPTVDSSTHTATNSHKVTSSFFLLPYCPDELLNLCRRRLRSGRSAGPDGFRASIIKQAVEFLIQPLTHLVNASFESGQFPLLLKTSQIIPIHKKGPSDMMENYRPIALTSVFSKIFEYAFLNRLNPFLLKHNILKHNQFGFRENLSTTDAILNFLKPISTSLEAGECPVGVFCDLSRAFDCINHEVLLRKLADYGIRGTPLNWISSFLTHRNQFVAIHNSSTRKSCSDITCVNVGVPQGTVLSPTLFSLYINDMVDFLDPACASTLYADDASFSVSSSDDLRLQIICNSNLTRLLNWYCLNSLFLNSSKTHYIRFHNPQKECPPLNLSIGNFLISSKESIRFLGLEVDQHLKWKNHCDNLRSKLHASCFLFKSLRKLLNLQQLIALYHAQVGSRIRYAILLWGNSTDVGDVFLAQKRVVRSMLGLRSIDSCRPYFKSLRILTLTSVYILELCTYVFKHKSTFATTRDIHSFNTRHKDNFYLPSTRLDVSRNLPNYIGPKIFNRLPSHLKNIQTIHKFKTALKNLLITHTFYDIHEFLAALDGTVDENQPLTL